MKDRLDILKDIRKTEAPEFLFTRIMQRIAPDNANRITPRLAWTLSISFLLVLALNIVAISKQLRDAPRQNMATSMELMTDNSLYHE